MCKIGDDLQLTALICSSGAHLVRDTSASNKWDISHDMYSMICAVPLLQDMGLSLCMPVQDASEVPVRDVGGSLERVRNVTVNLHALTAQTLTDMEKLFQVVQPNS